MVCSHTENQDQASFCPSAPLEISVLAEHTLGHLQVYRSSQAPPPVLSTRCRVTPPGEYRHLTPEARVCSMLGSPHH